MATCRDEVLAAARAITTAKRRTDFGVQEVVDYLASRGSRYAASTVKTHIVSRCCINAPDNHATTYGDFERVERGRYRLAR